MEFLLIAALVAVATAAPGLVQPGPTGPEPASNPQDSLIPKDIGAENIEYFEPVSIGPVIIDGFGPITVGAAIVDTPVDFSSSSPYVNINVKVDAAPGAVVNVHADACACGRALGGSPDSPEPIPPV